MRALPVFASLMLCAACGRPPELSTSGVDIVAASPGVTYRWSFDPAPHFPPSAPSPIESTASRTRFLAVLGKWNVERDDGANWIMRQHRDDEHPSRLLVEQLGFEGVVARTRCRIAGAGDGSSCGVVFGARSESEYAVARIDDRGVHLAYVSGTTEMSLGDYPAPVARNQWHDVRVWSLNGALSVTLDGGEAIGVDVPPVGFGRIGLYAKGDASFDDLAATVLRRAESPGAESR